MQHFALDIEIKPGQLWFTRDAGVARIDLDPNYACYADDARLCIRDGRPNEFESPRDLLTLACDPYRSEESEQAAARPSDLGDCYNPQRVQVGDVSKTVGGVTRREIRALEILKLFIAADLREGTALPENQTLEQYRAHACEFAVAWADALGDALNP